MMKSLFMAAAAAPLLAACATAAADESARYSQEAENADQRVLVVNGERIEIGDDENAGLVIVRAMEGAGDGANILLELDGMQWSPEDREEFERAMAEMAEAMEGMDFEFDMEMDFDGEGPGFMFFSEDGENFTVDIENMEEWQEEHAERMAEFHERHGERMAEMHERMAENQERVQVHVARVHEMADRARADGHRAHLMGIHAGMRGMESGIRSIERVLERGYVTEDGERRDLTAEEIEDLEEARDDLREQIDEFREEHAEALALVESGEHRMQNVFIRRNGEDGQNVFIRRMGDGEEVDTDERYEWRFDNDEALEGGQNVRVEIRNGERRVWVDGEELEGEALETWLENNAEVDGDRVRVRVQRDDENDG